MKKYKKEPLGGDEGTISHLEHEILLYIDRKLLIDSAAKMSISFVVLLVQICLYIAYIA